MVGKIRQAASGFGPWLGTQRSFHGTFKAVWLHGMLETHWGKARPVEVAISPVASTAQRREATAWPSSGWPSHCLIWCYPSQGCTTQTSQSCDFNSSEEKIAWLQMSLKKGMHVCVCVRVCVRVCVIKCARSCVHVCVCLPIYVYTYVGTSGSLSTTKSIKQSVLVHWIMENFPSDLSRNMCDV